MSFVIQSYRQTEQLQGGVLVKVREYHVVSNPSETYFQFRRAQPQWPNAKSVAGQLSTRIEAVAALPTVTDISYFQDVTSGGKLVDMMRTYYVTLDGTISGSVESDLAHFGPNYTGGQIAAEIAAGGDQLGS